VSQKRHVSEFCTRNSGSTRFIFDEFHINSPRTEHEGLKSCHVKSNAWNTPALPSNRLCEFLDRGQIVIPFGVSPLWYRVCAASRDEVPETSMRKIDSRKCMKSIIWSISGIHSLRALTEGMKYKYNSQYFCQHVIPDIHIQQNICSSGHRTTLNGILLYLDNAQAHNSRLS
jgi:hypothetical protein